MKWFEMREKRREAPAVLPVVMTYQTVYARVELPLSAAEDLSGAVWLQAEALSPFEDGAYAVGYEILCQTDEVLSILVAVAAHDVLEAQWHEALVARNALGEVRIDLSALVWAHVVRKRFPRCAQGRWLVVFRVAQEQLLLVLNEGVILGVRALAPTASDADVARETMLLLTQTELSDAGTAGLSMVCFAADVSAGDVLTNFGENLQVEVFSAEIAAEWFAEGALERAFAKDATFDLTPAFWLEEARAAKRRRWLVMGGSAAGVLWLIAAGALAGVPQVYARLNARVSEQLKAQHKAYAEVLDLRRRVSLIERYQDRRFSALEMLRLLCEAKSESMTFTSLNYRQKQLLRVSGLADDTSEVYALKETLQKDERIQEVKIQRLSQDPKTRRQRFDVEILFPVEEGVEA